MRPSTVLPLGLLLAQGHGAPGHGAPGHVTSGHRPRPTQIASRDVPYGTILTHCTVPGVVALTFDDGPFTHTSHVLDLLDQYGAKATFFINGANYAFGIDDE